MFKKEQRTYLFLAVFVVSLSFCITDPGSDSEFLYLLNFKLPQSCIYRIIDDFPCPGCGLTRSFVSISHGNVVNSFKYHPIGILIYIAFIWEIIFRLSLILSKKDSYTKVTKFLSWFPGVICMLSLFINWMYRIYIYHINK